MNDITIRPYARHDRESCLSVFRSNLPQFFRESEEAEFLAFIDSEKCSYLVLESDGQVVACGGFAIREESQEADLCWGMVDRRAHGRRLGELLLLVRLRGIVDSGRCQSIRLGTSQLTGSFFSKYGFQVQSVAVDGIATGLDEVEMRLEIDDVFREGVSKQWDGVKEHCRYE